MILLICTVTVRVRVGSRVVPEHQADTSFYEAMKRLAVEVAQKVEQEEISREKTAIERQKQSSIAVQEAVQITPFPFNPNTIPEDSLQMMNLPGFVYRNLIRYRKAGGTFHKAEDLKKIYGLDSATYEKLSPFIRIRPSISKKTYREKRNWDAVPVIGLNSADSTMLMLIPGIGPSYSRRIIKYREMLGGYYDTRQLWEVYGMDSARYKVLEEYCVVDTQYIKHIELNKATFRELISHPYISRSETYAILQYRDFAENISTIEELLNNQIIEEERLTKVAPYLRMGDDQD